MNKDNHNLYFFETESVVNKAKFNISNIEISKSLYHILTYEQSKACGFRITTAINCYEMFYCEYFPEMMRLKHRNLPNDIFNEIKEKRLSIEASNLHIQNCKISKAELFQHNPKLIQSNY
ncbi:hypothetical protein [Staphylococcus rostri]|uniref:hypothetical protein n=1 Tax=Staphylococcus rostri TaxID=522262 RepID=UPI0028525232|nr:hypothetical protein [Staphylococcus rostri]